MLGNFGTTEMLVILIVALLLFGKKLPEVARSIGRALGEFRRSMQGIESEIRGELYGDGRTAPLRSAAAVAPPAASPLPLPTTSPSTGPGLTATASPPKDPPA